MGLMASIRPTSFACEYSAVQSGGGADAMESPIALALFCFARQCYGVICWWPYAASVMSRRMLNFGTVLCRYVG